MQHDSPKENAAPSKSRASKGTASKSTASKKTASKSVAPSKSTAPPENAEPKDTQPMNAEPAEDAGAAKAPVSPHAERRAETMRLFHQMKKLPPGDPERERIREEIIRDHMPYARHIAVRYGGRGEIVEDFVQVAYLGLVKAADNFDPDHGTGFLGYATPMILGEIKRYFRDATWDVHVPRRMQELSSALRKATEQLTHDLGRSPTVAELAERLKADPEEITEALDATEAYTTASLDRPVRMESASATLTDFLGDDDPRFEAVVNREVLKPLLARLGERDKRILMMRFFRGMTQSEIAARLGISQMHVSRLLARSLAQLRDRAGAEAAPS